MKTIFISSAVLVVLLIIFQSFQYYTVSKIEKHKYTVLKEYENFEIRKYDSALFSSVRIDTNGYEATSSSGFRVLAGYIFGGNETGEKIAMTSPVVMELGDTTKMSFMVPSDYTLDELPKPNNKSIFFEEKKGCIMAAIRFGGWASDDKIEEYKRKLDNDLNKIGIAHSSKYVFLGYNPPYDLVNRRNEIIVELISYSN